MKIRNCTMVLLALLAMALNANQSFSQSVYTSYAFTTLAGQASTPGTNDGLGSAARFSYPGGLAVDTNGNIYVADAGNHTIRKVTPDGLAATLAGLAGSSGSANGTGSAARFDSPSGVAVDNVGNVYVADTWNHTIRKMTPAGVVTTLAGLAGSYGHANGTGSLARFYGPSGVGVDNAGNVYVADDENHTIRKVTPAGIVTTLAGWAGLYGSDNGMGSAARFHRPRGVAVDNAGNIYVADMYNNMIRKVTPAGMVTTLTGSAALFSWPQGVAVDTNGNVYVADAYNQTIRKVTPVGEVTTLAGVAGSSGQANGTGSDARFSIPAGVAVDSANNVYVADTGNHTIRSGFESFTPQFASPAYGVVENAGSAYILVTLGGIHTNVITVDYATSDGTATAGLDYVATNGTLTFSPGQKTSTIVVPIINDSLAEGSETMTLTLSHPTGGVLLGVPTNAVLTIADNDFFTLDPLYYDVNENEVTSTITVRRNGDVNGSTIALYFTSDGPLPDYYLPDLKPALAGVDYRTVVGILTFGAGETNKMFTVPILDNGRVDGERAFTVNLLYGSDSVSQGQTTIHDNELPAVIDFSFDPGSGVASQYFGSGTVNALALQPNGKILIGGIFDTVEDIGRTNLARLNADGSLDANFATSTSLTDAWGNASQVSIFSLRTNGQMVIAGNFTAVDGVSRNDLARLNADGSLDASFNAFSGCALTNQVTDQYGNPASAMIQALVVQSDGKIIIGGIFDTVNGVPRTNLARLNVNGSLDGTFVASTELTHFFVFWWDPFNPVEAVSSVSALSLETGGAILVGGTFITLNGVDRSSIARLNPNGSLDNNFLVGDGVEDGDNPGTVKSITVQADATVIIAGQFTSVHGVGRNNLARLNWDGSLDSGFDPAEYRNVDAVAVEDDGVIFIAPSSCGWGCSFQLKRINPDGTLDEGFPEVRGGGRIKAMVTQSDGNVLIGGPFYDININNGDPSFVTPGLARLYGNPNQPVVQFARHQDPNTGLYSPDITLGEDAGVATIPVQRLGDTTGSLTVNYATVNGTATAGVNYLASNGTLAFAPLQTTKTISIPILDDHQVRNDLQFRVALSNPSSGTTLGLNTLTVTVQNTDLGFLPGGITRQTNGQVTLSLGTSGSANYVVEASTNLFNWVPLATNLPTLTDSTAPLFNRRFYRARHLGP